VTARVSEAGGHSSIVTQRGSDLWRKTSPTVASFLSRCIYVSLIRSRAVHIALSNPFGPPKNIGWILFNYNTRLNNGIRLAG
jgi:hypothetical protein